MASVSDWANGIAPLLEPATTEETEVIVSLSDLHVPFHEPSLVDSAIRLIRKLSPHRVVLNGDVGDFFQLSRFNAGLERLDDLQEEIDEANKIRARIRKAAPNAQVIQTLGNHDERLITYVQRNARALTSLRALEPENLMNLNELEIRHVGGHGFRQRSNFLIKHGSMVRGEVGATAKAELTAAGVSGISGHTHRLGRYTKVGYQKRTWVEQGCMCKLEPEYITGPANWENGLVVGYFSTKSDNFLVEEVRSMDGKRFFYGGRTF